MILVNWIIINWMTIIVVIIMLIGDDFNNDGVIMRNINTNLFQ